MTEISELVKYASFVSVGFFFKGNCGLGVGAGGMRVPTSQLQENCF